VKVATKPAKGKWYEDRQIQSALIGAGVLLFVSVVGWLIFIRTNNAIDDSSETTTIPTEAETNAVSSDPIRTPMGRTPLYARTRRKVDELEHMLINDKLMPWRLLATGKPIEVTDYYGKTLHFEGIMFSGSPRTVFWGSFIEPFIENGIVEVLDATAEDCRANNLEPKPYLEEVASLLESMIRTVYGYMAETDQRLLGKSRQERKDVSDKIAKMNQLLKEHTAAVLLLFSESVELEERDADVDRRRPPPILREAEASIAPEETTVEANQTENRRIYEPGAALLEIFKSDSIENIPALPITRTYWDRDLVCTGNYVLPARIQDIGIGTTYVAKFSFYYEAKQPGVYGFTLIRSSIDSKYKLVVSGVAVVVMKERERVATSTAQGVCNLQRGFHRVEFLFLSRASKSRYGNNAGFQVKILPVGVFDAVPITKSMMLLIKE